MINYLNIIITFAILGPNILKFVSCIESTRHSVRSSTILNHFNGHQIAIKSPKLVNYSNHLILEFYIGSNLPYKNSL